MEKRPALGKGLSALIPDAPPEAPRGGTLELDIDRLTPNEYQPRGEMDDRRLEDLAASIRANGIIQPIVVRRVGDEFRIIAGERRWRAARRAGLQRVPVVVKQLEAEPSQKLLEMALVENIQRENLNPIEEATAYRRLVDEFQLTQDAVAAAVGKDRATVANTLRLLKLPAEIRNDVAGGAITMGHARALLALPAEQTQLQLAREIKTRSLSVRETESLVRRALDGSSPTEAGPRPVRTGPAPDVHTREAEDRLKIRLGTRTRIVRKGNRGRIEIDFTSEEELIRLFDLLTGGA